MSCILSGNLLNIQEDDDTETYKVILTKNPSMKNHPESTDNGLILYSNNRIFLSHFLSIFCVPLSLQQFYLVDKTITFNLKSIGTINPESLFKLSLHSMPAYSNTSITRSELLRVSPGVDWLKVTNWLKTDKIQLSIRDRTIDVNRKFKDRVIVTQWKGVIEKIILNLSFGSYSNNNNFSYGFLPSGTRYNAQDGNIDFSQGKPEIIVPKGDNTVVLYTVDDSVVCNTIYLGGIEDLVSLNDVNPIKYPTTLTGDYYCDGSSKHPCNSIILVDLIGGKTISTTNWSCAKAQLSNTYGSSGTFSDCNEYKSEKIYVTGESMKIKCIITKDGYTMTINNKSIHTKWTPSILKSLEHGMVLSMEYIGDEDGSVNVSNISINTNTKQSLYRTRKQEYIHNDETENNTINWIIVACLVITIVFLLLKPRNSKSII